MTLKQFYGSTTWKKIRNMRKIMDNYQCVKCGALADDVHHIEKITTNDLLYNYDKCIALSNLESVCRKCHNQKHKSKYPYHFDENGMIKPK